MAEIKLYGQLKRHPTRNIERDLRAICEKYEISRIDVYLSD